MNPTLLAALARVVFTGKPGERVGGVMSKQARALGTTRTEEMPAMTRARGEKG